MPFSLYAAQQAQALSSGEIWCGLIRVKHPDLVTLRFAVEANPVTSNGQVYTPWVADFQVPDAQPGQPAQGQISLDAVDQTVLDAIDALEGALTIDIELVLLSFPDDVMREWLDLRVEGIEGDGPRLVGRLRGARYAEEMTPWLRYVPDLFPGLFR